ncbi:MAG TPA: pilus assembly protein TadG-related protein [Candidatus Acidoferrales bacterium]|nr:pilus assembly protein TadG-related protein [Candidatus Acidoferrales bacterium]
MTGALARDEGGQALVIVALAMVLLMGALVLGVDWGYRIATSRSAQNEADAAALAAGRLLATQFNGTDFGALTQENVWSAACEARNANEGGPTDAVRSLGITFYADDGVTVVGQLLSSDPDENSTCTLAGATAVDDTTRYVRSDVGMSFMSLFGLITRQQLQADAVTRVHLTAAAAIRPLVLPPVTQPGDFATGTPGDGLSGFSTKPNAAIWPIVIRAGESWTASRSFDLVHRDRLPAGTYYVSLGHYSPHELQAAAQQGSLRSPHQLLTESDFTASVRRDHGHYDVTVPIANAADRTCGPTFDSFGPFGPVATAVADAGRCLIPNWFNYGFRGSVSVNTDWRDPSWSIFVNAGTSAELPTLTTPGDWLETIPADDVDPDIVAQDIRSFIGNYGRDVPGDPGDKSVVVNVFVWDCGESFNDTAPVGGRWDLNGGASCATSTTPPDRLHIVGVVPVTVRLNDVSTRGHVDVQVTWGGVFGDPGRCLTDAGRPDCAMNQFINSAFIVPDE